MPRLTDRLSRLEAVVSQGEQRFVWRGENETAEQAEARYLAANPDAAGCELMLFSWLPVSSPSA